MWLYDIIWDYIGLYGLYGFQPLANWNAHPSIMLYLHFLMFETYINPFYIQSTRLFLTAYMRVYWVIGVPLFSSKSLKKPMVTWGSHILRNFHVHGWVDNSGWLLKYNPGKFNMARQKIPIFHGKLRYIVFTCQANLLVYIGMSHIWLTYLLIITTC